MQFTLIDVNILIGGIAMKKIILGLIFIFCVFTTKSAYAKNVNIKISNKNYKATLINVKVDGENKVSKEMPSFIYQKRTLVPIRFLSETFGASVDWNSKTQAATISLADKSIVLTIDKAEAVINGVTKPIEKAYTPRLVRVNGGSARTYVPLRLISELFGYDVSWNNKSQTAIINTNTIIEEDTNDVIILPSGDDEPDQIKPDNDAIKPNPNANDNPSIKPNPDGYAHLTNVVLTRYNDKDAVLFQGLKGKYKVTKLDNPDRLVLDFEKAIFDDPELYREYSIVMNGIKGIRASQFADNDTSKSDKNVRIVMDLEDSAIDYQIDETNDGLVFYIKKSMKSFYSYDGRNFAIKNTEGRVSEHTYDDLRKTITMSVETNKDIETGTEKFKDPFISSLVIEKAANGYTFTINLVRNALVEKSDDRDADYSLRLSRIVNSKPSDYLIMIDPGHGGKDPGGVSKIDGSSEVDFIPIVARALEAKLKAAGYNVMKTNDTIDEYVDIFERAKMANSVNADVFISIHANVADSPAASGFEVLYSSEAKHKNKTRKQTEFANCILNAVGELVGNKGRGLKEGAYVVTRNTNMPAALLEMEFLSSKKGLALLKSQAYLDKMVDGLFNGIVDYLNNYY